MYNRSSKRNSLCMASSLMPLAAVRPWLLLCNTIVNMVTAVLQGEVKARLLCVQELSFFQQACALL